MGLKPHRDRLCVVQLSPGDGTVDVVRIAQGQRERAQPRAASRRSRRAEDLPLRPLRRGADPPRLRHRGRAVWCTKIASRLVRTYTDRHGLKDLTREVLGVDMSKQQQSSDWGAPQLSEAQIDYAASDVLHLHALKDGAGGAARARGAAGPRRILLPLPAGARRARPARLGGRGHLRPFLSAPPRSCCGAQPQITTLCRPRHRGT